MSAISFNKKSSQSMHHSFAYKTAEKILTFTFLSCRDLRLDLESLKSFFAIGFI